MSTFAQNQLAAGSAVSQGIYSYYQGKSQAQLAKKDPKAYVALKQQQNKMALIFFCIFIGLIVLGGLIWLIIYLVQRNQRKNDETKTDANVV